MNNMKLCHCFHDAVLYFRLHVRENGKLKVCISGLMETEVLEAKRLVQVLASCPIAVIVHRSQYHRFRTGNTTFSPGPTF